MTIPREITERTRNGTLVFTDCPPIKLWELGCPNELRIRRSEHDYFLELIEDECDPVFIKNLRETRIAKMREKGIEPDTTMQVGFNIQQFNCPTKIVWDNYREKGKERYASGVVRVVL